MDDALHPVVDGGGKAGVGRPPDKIATRNDGAMQPLDDNDGGGMIKHEGRGGGEGGNGRMSSNASPLWEHAKAFQRASILGIDIRQ